VIYIVTLSWCCGSMSRCTSRNGRPRPGSFWTVYDSHNTQDMLPQHQLNITM